MGYSTITLCNLFAEITNKLKPAKAEDNADNMEYLKEILKRDFDEILLGFGNGFTGNKRVKAEKETLYKILKPYAKKLVELVTIFRILTTNVIPAIISPDTINSHTPSQITIFRYTTLITTIPIQIPIK